jgi:hypothetical protein
VTQRLPAAMAWFAALWIGFGGLGLLTTLASLLDPFSEYPAWPVTVLVSLALVAGGYGVLRGRRWGPWLAIVAVAGGLAETVGWMLWAGAVTPVLLATAAFHLVGLGVLGRAIARGLRPTRAATGDVGEKHRPR